MRPLELRLADFRSYRGTGYAIDFRDRTLVGIVGPIGSGKSSILDAISFALYGKTRNVGRDTKSLIHQRSDGARVALRFEVEGEVWEAVRALRRKGQSQHALYRYEDDDHDPEAIEKVTGERDVNARIETLLGLDFDAFSRSVLLAQGYFQEFLRSRPAERDKVLKGVFGHDRVDAMREAAKDRVSAAEIEVGRLTVKAEQLDEIAERLAQRREALAAAEERVETLRKAEREVADLEASLESARTRRSAAVAETERLDGLAGKLPDPAQVERSIAAVTEAEAGRAQLAAALESAEAEVSTCQQALKALEEAGEEEVLERATALIAELVPRRQALAEARRRLEVAAERAESARSEIVTAGGRLEAARQAATIAKREAGEARRRLDEAEAALHEARHADMAMTLRAGLQPGDPCPVCEQVVGDIPETTTGADLERLDSQVHAAKATVAAAVEAESKAAAEVAAAQEALEAQERRLAGALTDQEGAEAAVAGAEQAVTNLEQQLAELLDTEDPGAELERRRAALGRLRSDLASARRAADHARSAHDQAIRLQQEAARALDQLRLTIAALAPQLGGEVAEAGMPTDLAAAVTGIRRRWEEATAAARKSIADCDAELKATQQQLRTVLETLGVEGTFTDALAEATATAKVLHEQIADGERRLEEGARLREELEDAAEKRDTYRRLASDLTDAKFIRFLLDDERARLAALGSDHFQRLSSGRYRFTEDGNFDIVDLTTADAVRKPESLSGGETFLASLALALSLAEMVTRTGGRLDSFFLDEGFGSLDPEHLDLAMEGIEALVTGGEDRLVVVVSHVPELRQRIEDLIVLDRDAVTGDTRVVRV